MQRISCYLHPGINLCQFIPESLGCLSWLHHEHDPVVIFIMHPSTTPLIHTCKFDQVWEDCSSHDIRMYVYKSNTALPSVLFESSSNPSLLIFFAKMIYSIYILQLSYFSRFHHWSCQYSYALPRDLKRSPWNSTLLFNEVELIIIWHHPMQLHYILCSQRGGNRIHCSNSNQYGLRYKFQQAFSWRVWNLGSVVDNLKFE